MPSVSERQRRFMGMELAKKRAGKKTKTHMSESQLRDFAKKPIADSDEEESSEPPDKVENESTEKEPVMKKRRKMSMF